jgi:hypothetical protein
MKASQIVYEAIGVLAEHGWIKGHARTQDGFCALGAMAHVANRNNLSVSQMLSVLEQASASFGEGLMKYNDDPSTSYEDIVLTMKTVANKLEEEGK